MTTILPTPNNPEGHAHYMRPLDGIRGFACMLVIASHICSILDLNFKEINNNLGSMGVALFFTLSGFLMSALYSEKAFSIESSAKYAIARAARIAPAYWIAITFAWALYMILPAGSAYEMGPIAMLRSIFFAGNVGVFWSIPPEIQFYGFFLFLWFAYDRMKAGNYLWAAVAAILCTVFIATRDMWGGLMLPSKLHLFFGGFLAAFLLQPEKIKRALCSIPSQIGLSIALILYFVYFLQSGKIYDDLIISVLIALFIASFSRSTAVARIFETNTMRMLGAASFSIYLFHDVILHAMHSLGAFQPLDTMTSIFVMSLISITLPVAFHYLAEKPLNLHARQWLLEQYEAVKARITERRTARS